MTEKNYIKEGLDLLKIILPGFLGTIFGLGLFDIQTKRGLFSGVWIGFQLSPLAILKYLTAYLK
jgi:hypothetical protein